MKIRLLKKIRGRYSIIKISNIEECESRVERLLLKAYNCSYYALKDKKSICYKYSPIRDEVINYLKILIRKNRQMFTKPTKRNKVWWVKNNNY